MRCRSSCCLSFLWVSASFETLWEKRCLNVGFSQGLISFSAVSYILILLEFWKRQRFLVLYAIGIVELQLESTSALVLLLFVIPLAFTLSGFLLWIMYALNGL